MIATPYFSMTTTEAVKFMTDTGKPVTINIHSQYTGVRFDRGYYQLYRNDTILYLIPESSCAALVWNRFTIEDFVSLGKYYKFEDYNGSN